MYNIYIYVNIYIYIHLILVPLVPAKTWTSISSDDLIKWVLPCPCFYRKDATYINLDPYSVIPYAHINIYIYGNRHPCDLPICVDKYHTYQTFPILRIY